MEQEPEAVSRTPSGGGFQDELSRRRQGNGTGMRKGGEKARGLAFAIRGIEGAPEEGQDARNRFGHGWRRGFPGRVRTHRRRTGKGFGDQAGRSFVVSARGRHRGRQAPQHVSEVRRLLARGEVFSSEAFTAFRAWMTEEVLVHFMDPRDEAWSGWPMSPEAFSVLQSLFRLNGATIDAVKRVLLGKPSPRPRRATVFDAAAKVLVQERRSRGDSVEGGRFPSRIIPSMGSGGSWRATSVPRVTTNTIWRWPETTSRHQRRHHDDGSRGGETAFGSTLFIDARTPGGEPVLVVRAINPSQASVDRTVSAAGIVETTIDLGDSYGQGEASAG